ncbi:MAG TPA: AAA family ATPase [Solirubrobacteraceae bacterium]
MARLIEREAEAAAVAGVLRAGGGVAVLEGAAGLGKTALLEVACRDARALGYAVAPARGSQLETEFPFGVVRQLFERRPEREALLAGPAAAAAPLLTGVAPDGAAADTSFAVLHGLYWVAVNLAADGPLLLAVDDVHWADAASQRWLAYLAARVEGLSLALVVALRLGEAAPAPAPVAALREAAAVTVRLRRLSAAAVEEIVRASWPDAGDAVCAAAHAATGGNPFYLHELLTAAAAEPDARLDPARLLSGDHAEVARRIVARTVGVDPRALRLAQALALLGDGCELRHAAALAELPMNEAERLVDGLARAELLAPDDPPRFLHPVLREAIEASMPAAGRDEAHRTAARVLHADGAPAGRVAAHLAGLRPAGDAWVPARLREAAQAAMASGTPASAAALLGRALAEPPPASQRAAVLREAARAEAAAGSERACMHLEQALALVDNAVTRAEIALEVAEAYAALFRWVDAVDVLERGLAELGGRAPALAARLEGELVVCGLHDARRASRVPPVLERLAVRGDAGGEPLAVAQAMAKLLSGSPAADIADPLEAALRAAGPGVQNWDTRAALLWVLVVAERFEAVEAAVAPLQEEVRRSGSARGLVAVYSTLGLLRLRLGALPEADAAARVALRVLQDGDFAPGLGFAATVLADIAVEAGELEEAQALLDLLPAGDWPPGVGTVLIPAARGRLRLAQRRPEEALADFEACLALFGSPAWSMPTRDTGYLHARAGAAAALVALGRRDRARELADAELADVRVLGAPRALGVALRAAGMARGGEIELLRESVAALRTSPAALERAHSLAQLGGALRRAGERAAAREPLAEALDLAARCGARPLAARVREELAATGARPRRPWRTGVESLTPTELRVARLAAEGRTNREIAHELYVTLKTVEGHLARTYVKLGISSRSGLPGLLDG